MFDHPRKTSYFSFERRPFLQKENVYGRANRDITIKNDLNIQYRLKRTTDELQ